MPGFSPRIDHRRARPRRSATPRLRVGGFMSINETDGGNETHVVDHEATIYRNSRKGDEPERPPGYCGARVAAADHVLRAGPAPPRRAGDRTHHPPPHGRHHAKARTTRRGAMPAGDSREAARANHAHRRVRARSARRPDRGGRLDHHRRARHRPGRRPRSHPGPTAPPQRATTGQAIRRPNTPAPDPGTRHDAPPRAGHSVGRNANSPSTNPPGRTPGRIHNRALERTRNRTRGRIRSRASGRIHAQAHGRDRNRARGPTNGQAHGPAHRRTHRPAHQRAHKPVHGREHGPAYGPAHRPAR